MSSILLIIAVLAGYGQWENVGPEGGEITALVQSTQNSDHLYAISGSNPSMVLFSDDNGESWESIGSFTSGSVYDLTMTQSGNLVAFGSSRVWRSTDGGFTWSSVSVSNTYFYQGTSHPTDGNVLFAAGYRYINSYWRIVFLKSVNGGQSWSATQLTSGATHAYGRSIGVSQSDPNVILVGGYEPSGTTSQRLYLSENGGTDFTEVTPPSSSNESYMYGAAIHPEDPDIMLAGTLYAVYRSTDRGSTWTKIATQYYNYRLRYSIADPSLVMAGGYSNIYRSTNGGLTWSSVNTGLSGNNFQHVLPSYDNASIAYTGSNAGFFNSTNGGTSWNMFTEGMTAGKVLVGCRSEGYVYIQLTSLGLFRIPEDSSEGWSSVNQASGCGDLAGLVSDGEGTLLALEAGG